MQKIILLIITLFLLFVTGNFISSIYTLWHKKDLLVHVQKQLDREESDNKRLKAELSQTTSNQFIEEQARNKLFLVKPGEQTIIIPQDTKDDTSETKIIISKKPNWEQWKELLHF